MEDYRYIFQKNYNETFHVSFHTYSRNISNETLNNLFSIQPEQFWNITRIFHKLLRERFNDYIKGIFCDILQFPSRNFSHTSINRIFPKPFENIPMENFR